MNMTTSFNTETCTTILLLVRKYEGTVEKVIFHDTSLAALTHAFAWDAVDRLLSRLTDVSTIIFDTPRFVLKETDPVWSQAMRRLLPNVRAEMEITRDSGFAVGSQNRLC